MLRDLFGLPKEYVPRLDIFMDGVFELTSFSVV